MNCFICGIPMRHYAADLWHCEDCSLYSSDIKPDVSLYDKSYVVKYGRYENTKLGQSIQDSRMCFVESWVRDGKLLDFGCGVGSFVRNCKGFDAAGFDINPFGDYCDVGRLFDNYKIVTFWDCLEHISDPVKVIAGLSPEYIFLCTPCTDDAIGPLTKWRHYMPGEHIHYFNSKSLRKLFEKCGYEVLEVNYSESRLRLGGGAKNIISIGGRKWER